MRCYRLVGSLDLLLDKIATDVIYIQLHLKGSLWQGLIRKYPLRTSQDTKVTSPFKHNKQWSSIDTTEYGAVQPVNLQHGVLAIG